MSPPPGAGTTRTAGASRHCSQRCPGRGGGAGGTCTSRTSAIRRGRRRRVRGVPASGSAPGWPAPGRRLIPARPLMPSPGGPSYAAARRGGPTHRCGWCQNHPCDLLADPSVSCAGIIADIPVLARARRACPGRVAIPSARLRVHAGWRRAMPEAGEERRPCVVYTPPLPHLSRHRPPMGRHWLPAHASASGPLGGDLVQRPASRLGETPSHEEGSG